MQVGKTAQNAIAVMSYLAECYRDKAGLVSSANVSNARKLSKPLAAKILTTLSQAGYVRGSTGPGGGYALAVKPSEVKLLDIVLLFEVKNQIMQCPFGADWCGNNDPCPMHNDILKMTEEMNKFLAEKDFSPFAEPGHCSARSKNP